MHFSFYISVELQIYFPGGPCGLLYTTLNVTVQCVNHLMKVTVNNKGESKEKDINPNSLSVVL